MELARSRNPQIILGLINGLTAPKSLWANRRLRLIVTGACNINCFYCHNEGQPKHDRFFPQTLVDHIVQLLPENPLDAITFTGGEALLHPELESLVEQFAPHFLRRTLVTNGLLLTPERLSRLFRAGLTKIRLGVDSITRRKHRPTPGAPTGISAHEAIQMLEESPLKFELNVVLTKFNKDEISNLLSLCSKRKISAKFFEHVEVREFGGKGNPGSIDTQPHVPFKVFDAEAKLIIGSPGEDVMAGANTVYTGDGYHIRYCRYLCDYGLCYLTGSRIDPTGAVYVCMERRGLHHITPNEAIKQTAATLRASVAAKCKPTMEVL